MQKVSCRITSKGQVTIPKRVRKQLGVEVSDTVTFIMHDDGSVEIRPEALSLRDLRGIVPPLPDRETVDFEDYIDEALQERADRLASGRTG